MLHPFHMGESHADWHELRFRGQLLGHYATADEARAAIEHTAKNAHESHRDAHIGDHAVAPKRPVEVYCRGAFVETFHNKDDAEAWIAKLLEEQAPTRRRRPGMVREAFEIVDRPAGEISAAERT